MVIDLAKLISLANQMQRLGVRYVLGAKADARDGKYEKNVNPETDGTLSTPVETVRGIDCSGFTRYALFNATEGAVRLPDGSQAQREYFEGLTGDEASDPVARYGFVNDDNNGPGLFICFIKPWTNGCGEVGHVWLVYKQGDGVEAVTLESHGGAGVVSRSWNNLGLRSEFFSGYRLQTV